MGGQSIAIIERLREMPAGIDEQDRRGGIDGGDEVQQHRRFRAERGDDGDPPGKTSRKAVDRMRSGGA